MEPLIPLDTSTKDLKLNDLQKWVLTFFVKDPKKIMTKEEIIDNMCLTALVDLDVNNVGNELNELKRHKLINYQVKAHESIVGSAGHLIKMPLKDGYIGTMEGRLYFKQKIILPLVLAKRNDKVGQIVTYLNDNYSQNQLAMEIKGLLYEKEQKTFVSKLANIAIDQFVPFLNILAKIQDRFFGSS